MICPNCKEDRGDLHVVKGRLICSQCKKRQIKSKMNELSKEQKQKLFSKSIPPSIA